jgi:hypothetical protein
MPRTTKAKPQRKKPSRRTLYSVHPGVELVRKRIDELPAKTGNSLEQWIKLIRRLGGTSVEERLEWLKREHGMGTNSAWWIAERASGGETHTVDDDPETYLQAAKQYVENMFSGGKAGLRPIYDKLLQVALSLGDDVKACPCQTIVPLYRKHVFAQLKPTTRTRLELGLALRNAPFTDRLIDTGGLAKNDRITHHIRIGSLKEIDADVKRWLMAAYELDA